MSEHDAVTEVRRFFESEPRRLLLPLFGAVILFLPIVSPNSSSVATQALLFGLFAISVDIALGYTGLLTLAPAAFFGLGAYSLAKVVVDYDASFWLGFPVAAVVAVAVAFPIGYVPIKRRIGQVYFALFTLAFGAITHDFVSVATEVTGGTNGLGFFSAPTVFGVDLSEPLFYHYFALVLVAVIATVLYALLRVDYGDILYATRQNELRMRYLGYDTDREKLIAWLISAVVSAIAGAAYVGMVGIASPSLVTFALTGEVIIWVIVGGSGTFVGPFAAAYLLTFVRDNLDNVWLEGYQLLLGLLFVVFVFLLPDGIVGLIGRDDE